MIKKGLNKPIIKKRRMKQTIVYKKKGLNTTVIIK